MTRPILTAGLRRLAREERGVITVFNLYMTVFCCMVGAVALDFTHFSAAETQLQAAADLGAHTALYTSRYGRYDPDTDIYHPISRDNEAAAEAAAIAAVRWGMPTGDFGPVVGADDIILGSLDHATGRVIPWDQVPRPNPAEPIVYDPKYIDSAAVVTHRANADSVESFLFRVIGFDSVDVSTGAIFSLGPGECDPTQGFFSQVKVEMNGNNTFYPGFCVGAPEIWVRNRNTFRPGVGVVAPAFGNLQLSNSDVDTHNPGLMDAFQYGPAAYDPVADYMASEMLLVQNNLVGLPSALSHFTQHAYAFQLLTRPGWTQVVTDRLMTPTVLTAGGTYTPSTLAPNKVYTATCNGGGPSGGIRLRDDASSRTFRNIVIVTNCRVDFDGQVRLVDAVISSSRNTGRPSIQAPASATGLTIGRDDDCDPTGGAALITRGIFDAAAQTNFYGALIRAGDRVDFQSNAQGEGVSIIAGNGKVDTNSNVSMAACGPAAGATTRDVSLRLRR